MKQKFLKYFPYLLIAGVVLFYVVRYRIAPSIETNEITVIDEMGVTTNLSAVLQFPAIVHFYANWCGPCLHEMKEISSSFANITGKGYHVYLLSDDAMEITEKWKTIFPESANFLAVLSLKEIEIRSIPTTYIFDRTGTMVLKKASPLEWSNPSFNQELELLLQ